MSISPRQVNIQLSCAGCDVAVDVNVTVCIQRQSRISSAAFVNLRINGNIAFLTSARRCATGQNSDTGPVIQFIIDGCIANFRVCC
ncbi:hypothetical protein O5625_24015, partial [Escherichia coli]|nr:hypothetical protein [Escherichia coli]